MKLRHVVDGPDGAPPLLLANSLGTDVEMWRPQVAALSERRRVVRYDHRGQGRSPVPPGPYALDELGRDAIDLLDELGIERAHLCGVSLGGMVAMWVAAHAPERVDRLVLCSTSAHMPPPEAWAERSATVREAGSTEPVADATIERWLTPEFRERDPDSADWLRAMVAASPAEGYAACCDALARMDLREAIGAVRAATLVVVGDDDPSTPPDHARAIAAAIPDARLEVVPDARHLLTVEHADTATRLILDHLDPQEPA